MACKIDGCERPVYVKKHDLCSLHYQRMRLGHLPMEAPPGRGRNRIAAKCSICNGRNHVARGLCKTCYQIAWSAAKWLDIPLDDLIAQINAAGVVEIRHIPS